MGVVGVWLDLKSSSYVIYLPLNCDRQQVFWFASPLVGVVRKIKTLCDAYTRVYIQVKGP